MLTKTTNKKGNFWTAIEYDLFSVLQLPFCHHSYSHLPLHQEDWFVVVTHPAYAVV